MKRQNTRLRESISVSTKIFALLSIIVFASLSCSDSDDGSSSEWTCAVGCSYVNPFQQTLEVTANVTQNQCNDDQASLQEDNPQKFCGQAYLNQPITACERLHPDFNPTDISEALFHCVLDWGNPPQLKICMDNRLEINPHCLDCAVTVGDNYDKCSFAATTVPHMDDCLQSYLTGLNGCTP